MQQVSLPMTYAGKGQQAFYPVHYSSRLLAKTVLILKRTVRDKSEVFWPYGLNRVQLRLRTFLREIIRLIRGIFYRNVLSFVITKIFYQQGNILHRTWPVSA